MTRPEHRAASVWLDLGNSPHIPFFRPVVAALEDRGIGVFLTARDFAQTVELARQAFGDIDIIGGWGRGAVAKSTATLTRAVALAGHVRGRGLRLAVSHNSYAQLLAARALGMPAVTMMDYEHQPANHLAFRLASLVMVPEVFPAEALRRQGARRVVRYPGFKEQVYLGSTPPSDTARKSLGVDDEVLAVLRPPPDFAAYHRFGNPLFEGAVDYLLGYPDTVAHMLPRTPAQAAWATGRWGDRVRFPDRVLPTADLLWAADVLIGAGGTMNRESALLGTPTYSLFAGAPSAVDQALAARGLMTHLAHADDLDRLAIRRKPERTWLPQDRGNRTLDAIVTSLLDLLDRQ
jgi:predicted glycosyltransferase